MFSNTLVTTEDLAAHLDDPRWIVFDCRFTLTDPEAGRQAYLKNHIPGAIYVHLDEDLSAPITETTGRHPLPATETFAEKLCHWGVGVNKQVVVYDDSFGAMAVRMWWMLRWLGHPGVALLDGGYPKWLRRQVAGLARRCRNRSTGATAPACRSRPRSSMPARSCMPSLTGEQLIIDARPERRFTGEFEPLDPVAGHIPGSINWSFEENLDIDGTFLPPEALRENFQALLKGRPAWQVIHSCGSGVTACHNLLAMEIAGLPGSRLYPGSWSEWIRDPSRPVATGD
jgi:thiosulfate/3-mercaptopyruvate sulfurtransferase